MNFSCYRPNPPAENVIVTLGGVVSGSSGVSQLNIRNKERMISMDWVSFISPTPPSLSE